MINRKTLSIILLSLLVVVSLALMGIYIFKRINMPDSDEGSGIMSGKIAERSTVYTPEREIPIPGHVGPGVDQETIEREIPIPGHVGPGVDQETIENETIFRRGPDTFWFDQQTNGMILKTIDGLVEAVDTDNKTIELSQTYSDGIKYMRIISLFDKNIPIFIVEYKIPEGVVGITAPKMILTEATLNDIQEGYRVIYYLEVPHMQEAKILIERR